MGSTVGIAGACRIVRLTGQGLFAAEEHGKRLDGTGKSRKVRDEAPVTSTGLELQELYDKHVEGHLVPRSGSKAMHMLVQFPTSLVGGNNADYMLKHARQFAESIFAEGCIFGDRVDRDEKGRHNVDLFLAPKYLKVTKRKAEPAISISKNLKELAISMGRWKEGNRPPPLVTQGQALQDAWFSYMRDQMGLKVVRGKKKVRAGSDWRSAEELEAERIINEAKEQAQSINNEANKLFKTAKEMVAEADRRMKEAKQYEEFNEAVYTEVLEEAASLKADAETDRADAKLDREKAAKELSEARKAGVAIAKIQEQMKLKWRAQMLLKQRHDEEYAARKAELQKREDSVKKRENELNVRELALESAKKAFEATKTELLRMKEVGAGLIYKLCGGILNLEDAQKVSPDGLSAQKVAEEIQPIWATFSKGFERD